MKINIPGWKPAVTVLAFAVLYTVALPFRPLFAPHEYDFAVAMLHYFPEMTGRVYPKLPAVVATLLTGILVWLTAWKMRMQYPWIALCSYLLFIPVWYFGTSASAIPVFTFAVSLTAALLYFGRKSDNILAKTGCVILAVPMALATAWFGKSVFFSWQCILMAFTPILAVTFCAYLEKLNDRDKAAKLVHRFNRVLIFCSLMLLVLLLLPPVFRMFNASYPQSLQLYPTGQSLVRPALTFLVPLLWFFMSASLQKFPEKSLTAAAGIGTMLFILPATVPWTYLLHNAPGEAVERLAPELKRNDPVFLSDKNSASVLRYQLRVDVREIGREADAIKPVDLKHYINKELEKGDVIVALSSKEFDSELPKEFTGVVHRVGKRRFIRYVGGKK